MKINFNLNRNNLGEKPESNQSEQILKNEPSTSSQPTDIKKAENEVADFLCGKSDTLMGSHGAQTSSVESTSSSTPTPSKQEEKGLLDEKIAPLTESNIKVEDVLYNGNPSDIQLELSETAIENAPSTKDESNTPSVNEVFYTQDEQTYNQDVFNDTNHNDNSHTEDASNDGVALEDQQPIGQIKDVEAQSDTTNAQFDMTKEAHQSSGVKVEELNHPQTNDTTKSDIMQTNHQNDEQEQEMPHVPNVSSSQEINHYLDKTKDNKLTAIDLEQLQVIVDKIKASNPQAQIEEFEALKKKDSKLDQEIYGHKVLAKQNEELLEKLLKQMKEISGKETVEEFAHYVQSVIENNEAEIQGYRQYITEKEAILTKINEDLAKL